MRFRSLTRRGILLRLSHMHAHDLTPRERELAEGVARGRQLTCSQLRPEQLADTDDEQHTVRAEVIRNILIGRLVDDPDPRGVRLAGAHITGMLDLDGARCNLGLDLQQCWLDRPITARYAQLPQLILSGSRMPALDAEGLQVDGSVLLSGIRITGDNQAGGIRLYGARVGGDLNCDGAQLHNKTGPALCAEGLQVEQAVFLRAGFEATGAGLAGAVRLLGARISRLECDGAKLRNDSGPALRSDSIVVDQRLFLRDGFEATGVGRLGAVRLNGARIGLLLCDGGKLRNDSGPALFAEAMLVERGVFLRAGFEATGAGDDGAVRLPGARISRLECDGAKLRNDSGPALFAEGLQVEQDVSLGAGFEATGAGKAGAVCLPGARIDGGLILSGARLLNLQDGAPALNARRLAVGGDILGNQGLTCHGEVHLNNADITGSILFEGARLANLGGCALDADDATVGAVVSCGEGFHAQGEIRFSYAKIPKLCFEGAHLSNLSNPCRRALTCGHLEAHELVLLTAEPIEGVVDLRHARVDLLRDDPKTWPRQLRLDSLSYGALADPPSVKERLSWLARDPDGYRPQPYEQLAATYRAKGLDEHARTVLVESQNRRRRRREGRRKGWREAWRDWPGRAWGRLLWATVGYGYRPWLALIWLVVLVVLGSLAVKFLLPDADFVEGEGAPTRNAFLYTVDVLLPFIDLGYAKWIATGAAQKVTFLLVVAGWVLATAVIAAFAGVLRRGD
jgi:hypothetical protein